MSSRCFEGFGRLRGLSRCLCSVLCLLGFSGFSQRSCCGLCLLRFFGRLLRRLSGHCFFPAFIRRTLPPAGCLALLAYALSFFACRCLYQLPLSSDLKALVPLRWWLRSKLLSLLLSQLLSLSLQLLTSRMLLSLLLALPQPWPPLLLSQV